MLLRVRRFTFFFLTASLVLPLDAATVSRQSAEEFSQKLALIQRHGESSARTERRTRLTEDELNSWFMYRAQPVLPSGVSQPQISILGDGRLSGQATIDLDAVAKRRAASGSGAFASAASCTRGTARPGSRYSARTCPEFRCRSQCSRNS
jgi:hypothetical protein